MITWREARAKVLAVYPDAQYQPINNCVWEGSGGARNDDPPIGGGDSESDAWINAAERLPVK